MALITAHSFLRIGILRASSLLPEGELSSCPFTADDLRKIIPNRKAVKTMDRRTQLACGSLLQAIGSERRFDERTGIAIAVGSASLGESDLAAALPESSHAETIPAALEKNLQPLWLLGRLPNMTAAHLAIQFQITGPSQTCGGGSLAGIQALSCAARWLHASEADTVITGATESYLESHWQLALKKQNRQPSESASTLLLAKPHHAEAESDLLGPISIHVDHFNDLARQFPSAMGDAKIFHDADSRISLEKWKSVLINPILPVWRVGEEIAHLVALFQSRQSGSIVRLMDEENAVIFIMEKRVS